MGPGEVVCESILQNKEMTKTYWEERMMAAADGAKNHKDSTPKEQFFDVEMDTSLLDCPDSLETLENVTASTSPKIVETMVKSCPDESVIEREIREQEEVLTTQTVVIHDSCEIKNDTYTPLQPLFRQLVNDNNNIDATNVTAVSAVSPTENRIALELREMQEREEELRQLRQRFSTSVSTTTTQGDLPSDTFQSIPTTDEGNFSEYGSEEKEMSLDGANSGSSRVMSPVVSPSHQGEFAHQRTQSMESMSSGHSSGSGGLSNHVQLLDPHQTPRRRITVKPLAEPEDDEVPAYIRNRMNETPIEREIRQSAQREEELRRLKGSVPVPVSPVTPTAGKWSAPRPGGLANDSRDVQHRIATSRIQQEIQEATQREKELVAAGQIQTLSEDTVDSKVTRFTELAEYAIAEQDRKIQSASSVNNIHDEIDGEEEPGQEKSAPANIVTNKRLVSQRPLSQQHSASALNLTMGNTPSIKPALKSPVTPVANTARWRKFEAAPNQRGLMQRFLASKGRLVGISPFASSPTNTNSPYSPTLLSPVHMHQTAPVFSPKSVDKITATQNTTEVKIAPELNNDVKVEPIVKPAPSRKGYMSAEEKIQEEMKEMKKREDELRLQRAHLFAQSQPNLLSLVDADDGEDSSLPGSHDDENAIVSLRSTISNPNLLDSDDSLSVTDSSSSYQAKTSQKAIRKRSALIAQWESMIQQNNNASEC